MSMTVDEFNRINALGVAAEALPSIHALGGHIEVDAGTVIFEEGDRGDHAYLLEEGEVEISVWRNGKKVTLARRGAGEIFGEMAIIDDQPRSATVTGISACRLLPITREQLVNRMDSADPVLRMFLKVILQRFRSTLQNLRGIDQNERLTDVPGPFVPLHTGASHEAAVREIKLEKELSQAIADREFVLFFQPIVCLESGVPTGLEALIRWHHPERGLVGPGNFIPTAEASGLIVPISQWVLEEACMCHVRLSQAFAAAGQGGADLTISLNVTAKDFTSADFSDFVRTTLEKTKVDPTKIRLEITENLLMYQPELAGQTLKRCKDMGLSFAIDDFGTGYSSLAYLNKFPVDIIKIDRSFVHMIEQENENYKIVQSIVSMAHNLEIDVVAEGVEQESQATVLRGMGCDFGQGFLYSKPIPEPATIRLIESWDLPAAPLTAVGG